MTDHDDCPHTIGGGDRDGILIPQGSEWYLPKHQRRGRLVEYICGMAGMGKSIPDSWWSDHSGERDDDRVEHEECRPYLEAYLRVLAITGAKVVHAYPQIEVRHPQLRYQGHIDQVWQWWQNREWVVDLKNGDPQPWHAFQLALYRDAYAETFNCALPPAANVYLPAGRIVERNDITDVIEARMLARAWWIRKERGLR